MCFVSGVIHLAEREAMALCFLACNSEIEM